MAIFWVSYVFIVSALASVDSATIIWPSNCVPLQMSLFFSASVTGTQKPLCSFDIYGPNLQIVKPDSGLKGPETSGATYSIQTGENVCK